MLSKATKEAIILSAFDGLILGGLLIDVISMLITHYVLSNNRANASNQRLWNRSIIAEIVACLSILLATLGILVMLADKYNWKSDLFSIPGNEPEQTTRPLSAEVINDIHDIGGDVHIHIDNSRDVPNSAEEEAVDKTLIPVSTPTPIPILTPTPTLPPSPTLSPSPSPTPMLTAEITPEPIAVSICTYQLDYDVYASSNFYNHKHPARTPEYVAAMAIDGKLNTAWNEGSDQVGRKRSEVVGEWLALRVRDGKEYQVAGLRIIGSFIKSIEKYKDNYRIKSLDIECDGHYVTTISLYDIPSYQTFWLPEPVIGSEFKFIIRSVYPDGIPRFPEGCITEIELLGLDVTDFSLGAASIDEFGYAVQCTKRFVLEGGELKKGNGRSMATAGMQVLLKEGFKLLSEEVNGRISDNTIMAIDELAELMRSTREIEHQLVPFTPGVVNTDYWNNMLIYLDWMANH